MRVVNHANHPDWTLREKQPQADSLALLKHIISILETKVKYHHVQSHQLKNKTFDQLELVPQKNEICDQNAKSRLVQSFLDDDYITGVLPFEQIRLVINDEKVTSSPTQAIHKFWSYKTARALFHNRKIVHKDHFKLIYWPGMGKVMQDFPRMFRVWVTNMYHISVVQIDSSTELTPGSKINVRAAANMMNLQAISTDVRIVVEHNCLKSQWKK